MAVEGSACTARLRRVFGWSTPNYSTKTILTFCFIFIAVPGLIHPSLSLDAVSDSVSQNDRERICSSMDIRNSLESFTKLENCEVIEGFLSILLIDNVNPTELSKFSFPKLTEITDYLLLYRVNGLHSLAQLFPNLAVIRGTNTFLNKALVIFEMSTLQEIGLYSLTTIMKGQVHIDKNPSLCFVKSIDWNKIVRENPAKNIVKSLKPSNECPVCPERIGNDNDNNTCPVRRDPSGTNKEYLCWNQNHCQKVCPPKCKYCNNRLKCCNKSCLACRDDNPEICTVCANISYKFDEQKQCRDECPQGLIKYLDRRCINRMQCLNETHKPIEMQSNYYPAEPFKIHNNTCLMECPPNFTESNSTDWNSTCVKCNGDCEKVCPGMNIDSVVMSRQLRGCTHINGSLEIQIRGGANLTELEENLKMIKEIKHYLKIVRSFSLISLNFLKKLEVIRGERLQNNFVFIVLDNQNLQDLWDWTNRTMRIDRGKLFFHFNPKLCYDKIEKLQEIAKLQNFSDLEVPRNSNGDKIACNIKTLNVNVLKIESENVSLQWDAFEDLEDQRRLLAYTIFYVATKDNISLYDGKDACGQDKWNIYDLPSKENEHIINYTITKLNPYTKYAFYVKTYTIAQERNGAQSPIKYFTTRTARPNQPTIRHISSPTFDSLEIRWDPPSRPNGPIDYYKINITKKTDQPFFRNSKDYNYCNDYVQQDTITSTSKPATSNDCKCEGTSKKVLNAAFEKEKKEEIEFEDELINIVYLKRPKRDLRDNTILYSNLNSTHQEPTKNKTENKSFFQKVKNATEFFQNGLHHYTAYEVAIEACRNDTETEKEECSVSSSKYTSTTLPKDGANRISELQVRSHSQDSVTISWNQPTDPNGKIFAYLIEYRRIDIPRAKEQPECHNVTTNNATLYYTVSKLNPGNYSLVVYAKSVNKKEQSEAIYFCIEEPSSNTTLIVCLVIFIAIVAVAVAFTYMYRKHQKDIFILNPNPNPEYVSVYIKDEWEVPRNKILLIKELGQGSFGMVWEGVANDIRDKSEVRCAVKTVNEHATDRERLEFLNEASVMKAFDTAHVVKLLGVVSEGQPTLVIMELMANGDLKSYLRSHRPDMENFNPSLVKHPPTLKQILQMAIEISDGMAYLSEKKYVHRDLAARNCMVSEELVVKIGDFGMTRDIYETDYYRKGTKGLLPVRWMAPESLKDGVFTSSSDVWSYGVVLWEMATLASQPYQGLSNEQVLRYVIDGGVMERPENCPDKLYTLMRYCWQHKPSSRPSFLKLCQLLLEDASPTFSEVSFYHSPAGVEARASRHTPSPNQDDQSTPLRIVAERLRGYTPQSQDSDVLDVDTHHHFPSLSESGIGVITTANGYVSGCPTNGGATTQC